jgi:putative copper resistance protein D
MAFGVLDVCLVVVLMAAPLLGRSSLRHRLLWWTGTAVVAVGVLGQPFGNPRQTFLATAVQFCLLFFVAPVLLALGYPRVRPASRALTLLGPVLACVVTLAWFLTPWLRVSLSHGAAFQAGHLAALALGFAFCWPAVAPRHDDAGDYPALLLVAFLELLLDAVAGIVITIRSDLLAPQVFLSHHGLAAAHTSQVHGGELLWVIAELLDIPFLAALVFGWVRADARQAAAVDAAAQATEDAEDASDPDLQRPWWETDASVFGERAKNYRRP